MSKHFDQVQKQAQDREAKDPTALVSIFDEQGFYRHASPAHNELLGYSGSELLGMHWTEMMVEGDDLRSAHVVRTIAELQAGQPVLMHFRVKHKSGLPVTIDGNLTFLRVAGEGFLLTTSNVVQPG
jgi:PAS domain S-box-containing protein